MIWANVTKFGQNFIAPPKFFGLVRLCIHYNSIYANVTLNKKFAFSSVATQALTLTPGLHNIRPANAFCAARESISKSINKRSMSALCIPCAVCNRKHFE